jgi:hypothetical protein
VRSTRGREDPARNINRKEMDGETLVCARGEFDEHEMPAVAHATSSVLLPPSRKARTTSAENHKVKIIAEQTSLAFASCPPAVPRDLSIFERSIAIATWR